MPWPISASVIDVEYNSSALLRTHATTTGEGEGLISSEVRSREAEDRLHIIGLTDVGRFPVA